MTQRRRSPAEARRRPFGAPLVAAFRGLGRMLRRPRAATAAAPDLAAVLEAAAIDGLDSRWQEIFFITIPSMRPQMLFGAVIALVGTFQAGAIGVTLSGSNPTPQYAGQLIVNHIEDYGFLRYEMGYAAAVSVVLLLMVLFFSRIATRLFGSENS